MLVAGKTIRSAMFALALTSFALSLVPADAHAQAAAPNGWNDPFPAHKIIDNFYYVGTKELGSFLITTPAGHILMNSNYEASVPVIQAGVKELGFEFKDIKILIAGHAHPDHIEGDALVKQLTGAQVVVGRKEVEVTQRMKPGGKEHPIDRIIDDGGKVELGGMVLTAHEMPGHTRGCLAWSMNLKEGGKTYYAFVECSLNGQFVQTLDQYPGILEDFRATYKKARTFPVELFVSSHGQFYGMAAKYEKLKTRKDGDPNPFVDPKGYLDHVDQFEATFERALTQPAGAGRGGRGGRGQAPATAPAQEQGQRQ
jgi:metallo-beta-lactamase class B